VMKWVIVLGFNTMRQDVSPVIVVGSVLVCIGLCMYNSLKSGYSMYEKLPVFKTPIEL
jgi:hypothetical protein